MAPDPANREVGVGIAIHPKSVIDEREALSKARVYGVHASMQYIHMYMCAPAYMQNALINIARP